MLVSRQLLVHCCLLTVDGPLTDACLSVAIALESASVGFVELDELVLRWGAGGYLLLATGRNDAAFAGICVQK